MTSRRLAKDIGGDGRPLATAILILLIVFGLAVRVPGLNESLWLDEAATWSQVGSGSLVGTITATSTDTYPPLHNLLTLPFTLLLGPSEIALRLAALLCGVAAIPVAYWLGAMVGGRRIGLLSAAMIALSPFAIFYAQEARMYSLLMLTAMLMAGATVMWLGRSTALRSVALLAAGAALLYSHPYGSFALVGIAVAGVIATILDKSDWRRVAGYLGLQLGVGLLYLPWLFISLNVARRLARTGFWIERPNLNLAFHYVEELAGGPFGLALLAVGWLLAMPVAGRLLRPAARRISPPPSRNAILVLAGVAIAPLLLGYVVSQFTTPILVARYLICSLPALCVLAALGLARIHDHLPNLAVLSGLIVALSVPAVTATSYPRHDEDWRSLAAFLKTNMRPDDCLFMSAPFLLRPLQYYGVDKPACYLATVAEAVVDQPLKRLIAVTAYYDGGLAAVRDAFPGIWTAEQNFGRGLALAIREPAR